ncbi:MAG: hypothetical protein QM784_00230 [Polyangiaceae bacterium]
MELRIVEVDDELVVLRWDGQKDLGDVPRNTVGPQPPSCGLPSRGDRALRRPPGHGAPWGPVQVVAVEGSEVTVEDIERVRTVVDSRDVCPLGEPKALPEGGGETGGNGGTNSGKHSRRENRGFLQ